MDVGNIILLRTDNDHLKVRDRMKTKQQYIVLKFDEISLSTLNVQGIMEVIQDYLVIYGYRVKEYGEDNSLLNSSARGYLYERLDVNEV